MNNSNKKVNTVASSNPSVTETHNTSKRKSALPLDCRITNVSVTVYPEQFVGRNKAMELKSYASYRLPKESEGSVSDTDTFTADCLQYDDKPLSEEEKTRRLEELMKLVREADKNLVEVSAIIHDREEKPVPGSFYLTEPAEPHCHLVMHFKKQIRLNTALAMFGLYFRPGIDQKLWENGVSKFHVNSYGTMILYLTHETDSDSINDKIIYPRDQIVSNLSDSELDAIRAGADTSTNKKNLTQNDFEALSAKAYDAGYKLLDSIDFSKELPLERMSARQETVIRKRYREGYDTRIRELLRHRKYIPRVAIFVEGEKGWGKSQSVINACTELNLNLYNASFQKTGRYDGLKADHDVLIFDDDTAEKEIMTVSDSHACQLYKRNSGAAVWCGEYVIVLSNLSFDKWIQKCGIHHTEEFAAAKSRFFICNMSFSDDHHRIHLISENTRSGGADNGQLKEKALVFINAMQKSLDEWDLLRTGVTNNDMNTPNDDDWDDDYYYVETNGNPYCIVDGVYYGTATDEDFIFPDGIPICEIVSEEDAPFTEEDYPWPEE